MAQWGQFAGSPFSCGWCLSWLTPSGCGKAASCIPCVSWTTLLVAANGRAGPWGLSPLRHGPLAKPRVARPRFWFLVSTLPAQWGHCARTGYGGGFEGNVSKNHHLLIPPQRFAREDRSPFRHSVAGETASPSRHRQTGILFDAPTPNAQSRVDSPPRSDGFTNKGGSQSV